MTLKARVSLMVGVLLVAAVALFAVIMARGQERALAREMEGKQLELAAGLSEICRDAIVGQQFLSLSNYLKRLSASDDVLEAFCAREDGEILGHTDVALTHTPVDKNVANLLAVDAPMVGDVISGEGVSRAVPSGAVSAAAPVYMAGRRVASALILFSREAFHRRFTESLAEARRRIVLAALLVMAAGVAGAFALTAWVLRPMGVLVAGVRTFASGKLDARVPLESRDELGLLAREFNQMAGRLKELDRMKEDFVSAVTHDLKSPVARTQVALEVIQDEAAKSDAGRGDAARMADALLQARESQDRLFAHITSLLDVARIESALSLDKAPVSLEDLASRVERSFALIARKKGLSLDLIVEADLPPFPLDAAKMERALGNLVGNAVKFTDKGSVRIRLSDAGDRARLTVEDTGPGIPAEAMEKLFSKFFRAGAKAEGAGLGLTIAKGFVEAHGGVLAVESLPGRGTTFAISLPKS